MGAARDAFCSIYKKREQSNLVSNILEQLDFHPLSITLLATVAHQSRWDTDRLTREWERQRTDMLQTEHDKSLTTTIELSLTSPLFRDLGPDARALLGVVAFFPQGVNENNLDWLFPTVLNRTSVFDKFCILSLTYRSNGFVTMLAPLREYLRPKDPKSSPLLCMAKEHYFVRMSVDPNPNEHGFGETRWITSEDVNVEYLLDIFTSVDGDSDNVWEACANFMNHLNWHKQRLTVLGPKIEGLPDDQPSKPDCLLELSLLFNSVGNRVERKRLLTHALKLWRERGSDPHVARALRHLSSTNRLMDLHEEGTRQAREALEICERLGDTVEQAWCLVDLARLLGGDQEFHAAEEAASRAVDLLPEKGQQFLVCECHRVLGNIYRSMDKTERAIHHYEVAHGIASSFNWHDQLFSVHYSLAGMFLDEGRFDSAQAHVEQAKLHMVDNPYYLGYATELQAELWYKHHRLDYARSEARRAADIYEKLGAEDDIEDCKELLRNIQKEMNFQAASGQSGPNCEFL